MKIKNVSVCDIYYLKYTCEFKKYDEFVLIV